MKSKQHTEAPIFINLFSNKIVIKQKLDTHLRGNSDTENNVYVKHSKVVNFSWKFCTF